MSYFPDDIPFMSDNELKENGIRIPKDVPDTIYRQAAIAEIDRWVQAFKETRHMQSASDARFIKSGIAELPSAQPEIIRCKDCKHYYYADNRIPEEQRYTCDLDGDRWKPDSFCSFAERRDENERHDQQAGGD